MDVNGLIQKIEGYGGKDTIFSIELILKVFGLESEEDAALLFGKALGASKWIYSPRNLDMGLQDHFVFTIELKVDFYFDIFGEDSESLIKQIQEFCALKNVLKKMGSFVEQNEMI